MLCDSQSWTSDAEFAKAFFLEANRRRVPIQGSLDLTPRCNLRCLHCYISSDGCRKSCAGRVELSASAIRRILDEVIDAGCLYFLITGGEPLLRSDFEEVYVHARSRGLLVSLFTNGTLVSERHAAVLRDLPPWNVELTMYGATAGTYETVTGVSGSYSMFRRGLDRLLDKPGIDVRLKTVLLKENIHEFEAMRDFAASRGLRFRFDGAISRTLAGEGRPAESRVDPEVLAGIEFSDPKLAASWRRLAAAAPERPPQVRRMVYQCGAGRSMFHVDAFGGLHPCLSVRHPGFLLGDGATFRDGWDRYLRGIVAREWDRPIACESCDMHIFCNYCPGSVISGSSDDVGPDGFFCRLGRQRKLKYDALVAAEPKQAGVE